jgi:beta-glucosidase
MKRSFLCTPIVSIVVVSACGRNPGSGGHPPGSGGGGGDAAVGDLGAAPPGDGMADASTDAGPIGATACLAPSTMRAAAIVSQMTLDQKVLEMHGVGGASPNKRIVPAVASLGIPAFVVTNGPDGATNGTVDPVPPATALPCTLALAATWDVALGNAYGQVVGKEARTLGNELLEGPDMNLARIPQGGRTFENLGEDPFLAGRIAVADIAGIQSQGEIAEAKHFLNNEQEANRMAINAVVDERTERELYLAPFEMAVKEGCVGAVMCAYPQVNGTYSCESGTLLNQILKQEWGFAGVVTSDFGAVHSTVPSVTNGLDLEMPDGRFLGAPLASAVTAGTVMPALIDEHLTRRFATTMALGLWDSPPAATPIPMSLEMADAATARQIAAAGIVLLKNDNGLLPLDATKVHSIALIGPFAGAAKTGGGGSSAVVPLHTVTPLAGLMAQAGGATITMDPGNVISSAQAIAKTADVAIVMVGDNRTEGADAPIALSGNQDALVAAIAATNPHTIVVLKTGSVALMPWAGNVPAIVEAWYPGEEDGNAVADVLYGKVNPSGKLPITFPASLADLPANTPSQYPTAATAGIAQAHYTEGLLMGYRFYDAHNVAPLFPFGFGLSYTTFTYANLTVAAAPADAVTVEFDVTNSGARDGAEVAEVYVAMPAAAGEPPQQLKGFQKLSLAAGASGHVKITLAARAFQHWDVASHAWAVTPGAYRILVGASSRDLPLVGMINK